MLFVSLSSPCVGFEFSNLTDRSCLDAFGPFVTGAAVPSEPSTVPTRAWGKKHGENTWNDGKLLQVVSG